MDIWAVYSAGAALMGVGLQLFSSLQTFTRRLGICFCIVSLCFFGYGLKEKIHEQKEISSLVEFLNEGKDDLSEWKNSFYIYDDAGKNVEESKYRDWYIKTEDYLKQNDKAAAIIFEIYTEDGQACDKDFLKGRIASLESILSAK
jgi:hypothetical protein